MKIILGFYIGIQNYLLDDFEPGNEDASEIERADKVGDAFSRGEVRVALDGLGLDWPEPTLDMEAVVGDDEPGLPMLLYINAIFEVPTENEDQILQLEDELDEQLNAVLTAGEITIPFDGVVETETED